MPLQSSLTATVLCDGSSQIPLAVDVAGRKLAATARTAPQTTTSARGELHNRSPSASRNVVRKCLLGTKLQTATIVLTMLP
jgi:hypothetical protein